MPQSQSNLDSCISDPTIGEVHKLVTYCVTTSRQGSLLRFLRWPPFPRPSFIPVRPITSLSFPSLRRPLASSPSTLVEQDSYRTVTRLPLNPSEWTVPPWRTYRTNFSPSPIRSTCLLKGGGVKAASIYLHPVPGCRCNFRDLFIAWLGPLSSSTIPYGPRDRSFLRFYLRTVWFEW